MDVRPLLEDGSLRLEVDPVLLPAVARWVPLLPREGPLGGRAAISVRVADGAMETPPPGHRTLALGRVQAWVEPVRAVLCGADGLRGSVSFAGLHAELRVPPPGRGDDADFATAWEVYSACTLAAALLLGRMGHALAHAAAVASAGGGAWLLVGDTHAGKTTTCANLLSAGWNYLSDDHVVLGRGDGGLVVEGWPRPFHLDDGWEEGRTAHRRGETDPRTRWPGRWRRTAPLAGILFPRVEPALPTALEPVDPSDALARLLRQSPWLLADPGAAATVLALLRDAALLPARVLRLGLDSYADPPVLLDALAPLPS